MTVWKYKTGNMLKNNCNANILVNPVNCVGVMGAGLALQFKQTFGKEYFDDYRHQCEKGYVNVKGDLLTNKCGYNNYPFYIIDSEHVVYNFATKQEYKFKSKLEYVNNSLTLLRGFILWSLNKATDSKDDILSISIPPVGCGLGGLSIDKIETRIIDTLDNINNLEVYMWNFR